MIVSITEKIKFIESAFGKGQLGPNSKNFDVKCPIPTCHSQKNAQKKKLSIHVSTFMCHCWSCGYSSKSIRWLLSQHASKQKVEEFNQKFCPDYVDNTSTGEEVEKKIATLPEDFRLIANAPFGDIAARQARRYVTSRGFTEADQWFYRLGVSDEHAWAGRVIMPSFSADGELNFVVGRASYKSKLPYLFSEVDRKSIVFNEVNVNWNKPVVLCEGPFDAVKCGQNVIPMLGSALTDKYALFTTIAMMETPVFLAMDADTWDNKMLVVLKNLQLYDIDVKVVNVEPYKDPGEMTKEQFQEALGRATRIDWNDAFQLKLEKKTKTHMYTT